MWFKNIRLYCFTKPFELSAEDLEYKLSQQSFRPCGTHAKYSYGWTSPLGRESDMFTHVVGDYIMICGQREDKIMPASVINEALEEQVSQLEQRQDRKIYRKEKMQLKDDVIATLLPRAFTRTQQIHAYIAVKDNLLIVNTVSASRAEELLNFLRGTIDALPVSLPNVNRAPSDVMTRWLLKQDPDDKFDIDQDCELYNPLDGSNVIRCKSQDLYTDEIQSHLSAGKQVKNLGVTWNGILNCVITDELAIKKIKFEGIITDKSKEREAESMAEQFDQDFAIMTLEFRGFFAALFESFGGLQE
ncbi:MAG: recombination-associated protein RdgC [Gammaproteobacteria bacterium]|jgi:recombination associated protein RdgC|nr:recombination-associated protein RdgC [Gammaproteobacteria bacterium]MBT5202624.1 recombination-associated protein RdgC [Gammaproteobacteria bacterium]MBT5602680.1 recombination-associated protein RdgC [Gammaproteobacteria bacterium]